MRSPVSVLALAFFLLPACGDKAAPPAPSAGGSPTSANAPAAPGGAAASPTGSRYLLAAEPAGAVSVLEAKVKGEAKEVVVVGRVKDTVSGLAAFTLTDASLMYCGQDGTDDGCPTPWDYCCISKDRVAAATMAVGVRTNGEVVASAVPELRNMDLVVVRGRLVKTADGATRLDADGWFRKERPVVPANVVFPK